MKHLGGLLLAMLMAIWAAGAAAQGYPSRPVKMIVPFAAGGAVDIVGRTMAQVLNTATGQPFVVENRPGAGGLIALDAVAKSAPDGYTLAVGGNGPLSMSPNLYRDMKFDPLARLDPIIWFSAAPGVLVVRADLKANSVNELLALTRATPNGLTMGSGGSGSLPHLMGEYFQATAGVKWLHVPFKGSAPALTEMVGGRIDVMTDVVATAVPFVRSGKLRALAVTTLKRSAQLPDVPTLDELGYKGFNISSEVSLLAPKGTPTDVIARVNAELNKSLQTEEIKARLAGIGAAPEGGSPERLGERVRLELERWGKVIRDANVTLQ